MSISDLISDQLIFENEILFAFSDKKDWTIVVNDFQVIIEKNGLINSLSKIVVKSVNACSLLFSRR